MLLSPVRLTFNVTLDLRESRGLKEKKPEKTWPKQRKEIKEALTFLPFLESNSS